MKLPMRLITVPPRPEEKERPCLNCGVATDKRSGCCSRECFAAFKSKGASSPWANQSNTQSTVQRGDGMIERTPAKPPLTGGGRKCIYCRKSVPRQFQKSHLEKTHHVLAPIVSNFYKV